MGKRGKEMAIGRHLAFYVLMALIYPPNALAGVPVQLETQSIVVPNPDGGTIATAMTIYLDVKDEKQVRTVCQSLPQMKQAFFLALQERPVQSQKRMLIMKPVAGILEDAAAKVFGPEVIEKIYIMPGKRKFAEGTGTRRVSGATRNCIALQEVPEFAVMYDRSLHTEIRKPRASGTSTTPPTDPDQAALKYPTEQGQSIFATPGKSETASEQITETLNEAVSSDDSNTENIEEKPLRYEAESKSPPDSNTQPSSPASETQIPATIPPDTRLKPDKPDLATEWNQNAKSRIIRVADRNADIGFSTGTWVMIGVFLVVVLAGGAFLGVGIMRFRSERRQKERRRKERRQNFVPYTGDEQRDEPRRNNTDKRVKPERRNR